MRPLIVGIAFLSIGAVCSAQSSSSNSSNSGSGQQDTTQPQAASSADGKTATQPPAPAGKKKPKKVWTNEELATAKSGASADRSEGLKTSDGSSSTATSRSEGYTRPSNYDILVRTYLDRLRPLRSDLADLDRKIQQAREAKGNPREDTAAWIAVQEKKRQDVLAKIDRLEEEAEHRGVLPGDLRE